MTDKIINPVSKKAYAVLRKQFGFTVIEVTITGYYKSVDMYSVKEKGHKTEYVIKASRIFNRKIDAVKRKNTLINYERKGTIPALL